MTMLEMMQGLESGRQQRENLVRNTHSVDKLAKEIKEMCKVTLTNGETKGDEYQKCIRFYNKLLSDEIILDRKTFEEILKYCFTGTDNNAAWKLVCNIMKREKKYNDKNPKGSSTVDAEDTFSDACEAAKIGDFETLGECIDNVLASNNPGLLLNNSTGTSKKTILHLAVFQSYNASFVPNQLKCINLILSYARKLQMKNVLLDQTDKTGKTALQIAIENKSDEICKELLSHGAKICYQEKLASSDENILLEMLYENVPGAVTYLFDRNIEIKPDQSNEQKIHLDYTNIIGFIHQPERIVNSQSNSHDMEMGEKQPLSLKESKKEMDVTFLAKMIYKPQFNANTIVRHSLVKNFIQEKSESKTKYLATYFIIQVILYLLYLFLMADIYWYKCPQSNFDSNSNDTNTMSENNIKCRFSVLEYILIPVLYIFAILMSSMEIFEFMNLAKLKPSEKWNPYFSEKENYFQIIFMVLSLGTTLPILFQQTVFFNFQYFFASIGVFFAAVSFLCAIGNGNFTYSEYVFVYGKIMKRFATVLLTFLILIAAFVISFFITFPELSTFYITKTFMMLSGEFNFDDDFKDFKPPSGTFNSVFGQIQYVMFALSVTIVFVNIFLGYTIGDIEELRANADVSKSKIQIKQLFIIDEIDKTFGLKKSNKRRM